ncbi:hypothetical protein ACI8AF_00930 [Blastococcus sp. SYSU D00669]
MAGEVGTDEERDVAEADRAADDAPTAHDRPPADDRPPAEEEPLAATPAPEPPAAPVVTARRRRRAWPWLVALPLIGALLFGGAAFAANQLTDPTYTATALIAVLPDDDTTDVSIPVAGIWAEIGNSEALLARAAEELDVDEATLARSVTVTTAANAPVLSVTATTTDPERSADWANAVGGELVAEEAANPVPRYGLQSAAIAVPPATGTELVSPLLMVAAAVLGALVGLVLAQAVVRRRRRRAAA